MKLLTVRGMMALIAGLSLICAAIAYQVRMARWVNEGAHRNQCAANLRQIGIAIGWYSQAPGPGRSGYGVYPPGNVPITSIAPNRRCGWASLIYLSNDEGCSGCPSVATDMAWDDTRQEGAYGRDHEMFCPSLPRSLPGTGFVPAAYIGIAGLGVDAPSLPITDRRAGIFGDDRIVAPKDVTDGLGQTMMVVESSAKAGPWFAGGRNTVRGLDPSRKPYLGQGRQFGGIHPGGANVLMADGSVRFVRDSVDPKVIESASTIAGGEIIPPPWTP